MKNYVSQCFLLTVLFLTSCRPTEYVADTGLSDLSDDEDPIQQFFDQSDVFKQSITGFALYDPETDSLLHNRDADRFFTPASNTKILTLYASLKTLPDTLPSLRYHVQNDTLYFRGTGDPSFLNPNLDSNNEVLEFLQSRDETLVYDDSNFEDAHFGAGWSWDWYPAAYAPEKSPFPIYGNMMTLRTEQVLLVKLDDDEPVEPRFFIKYIKDMGWDTDQIELVKRDYQTNDIFYVPKSDTVRQERSIPFKYEKDLFLEMLSDTLGREVISIDTDNIEFSDTFYSTPAEPLYQRMMQVSDNFIAEQLMLMISDHEFGEMNTELAIEFALENYLSILPAEPQWSDGSGLTRYNLITPHSLVILLEELVQEYGEERILALFPAGGESGTIRYNYGAPEGEEPYVYAKTGTLSNNTALSGYLFTDSGRRLNFSMMNNNYVMSNNTLRAEMGRLLEFIKENY